jgi:nicotinate-nucleotide adenylyltransferase
MADPMRIGILGGSFDPPHIGHLWIAEAVREALKLDEIRWIPAAISPLKPDGPVASNEQRRQMVALAVSGCAEYLVDDRELNRGDVSYTVDTLQGLKTEFPKAEFFLIMGSDSLASLQQWHQPKRLLELATLVVLQRGADDDIDFNVLSGLTSETQIQRIRESQVAMPLIELSSSEIRERLRNGHSIRFRTSRSVEAYIKAEKLYQATPENASRT